MERLRIERGKERERTERMVETDANRERERDYYTDEDNNI